MEEDDTIFGLNPWLLRAIVITIAIDIFILFKDGFSERLLTGNLIILSICASSIFSERFIASYFESRIQGSFKLGLTVYSIYGLLSYVLFKVLDYIF